MAVSSTAIPYGTPAQYRSSYESRAGGSGFRAPGFFGQDAGGQAAPAATPATPPVTAATRALFDVRAQDEGGGGVGAQGTAGPDRRTEEEGNQIDTNTAFGRAGIANQGPQIGTRATEDPYEMADAVFGGISGAALRAAFEMLGWENPLSAKALFGTKTPEAANTAEVPAAPPASPVESAVPDVTGEPPTPTDDPGEDPGGDIERSEAGPAPVGPSAGDFASPEAELAHGGRVPPKAPARRPMMMPPPTAAASALQGVTSRPPARAMPPRRPPPGKPPMKAGAPMGRSMPPPNAGRPYARGGRV